MACYWPIGYDNEGLLQSPRGIKASFLNKRSVVQNTGKRIDPLFTIIVAQDVTRLRLCVKIVLGEKCVRPFSLSHFLTCIPAPCLFRHAWRLASSVKIDQNRTNFPGAFFCVVQVQIHKLRVFDITGSPGPGHGERRTTEA